MTDDTYDVVNHDPSIDALASRELVDEWFGSPGEEGSEHPDTPPHDRPGRPVELAKHEIMGGDQSTTPEEETHGQDPRQ